MHTGGEIMADDTEFEVTMQPKLVKAATIVRAANGFICTCEGKDPHIEKNLSMALNKLDEWFREGDE